jgi:hypothetical protein
MKVMRRQREVVRCAVVVGVVVCSVMFAGAARAGVTSRATPHAHVIGARSTSSATWRVLETPPPPVGANISLSSVSCSKKTCMVVGMDNQGFGHIRPFSELWNGVNWTVLGDAPTPVATWSANLLSVSCASPVSCVAVGVLSLGENSIAGPNQALVEVYDGHGWTYESTAISRNTESYYGYVLDGVSCTSVNSCVVVGTESDIHDTPQPVAGQWDGAALSLRATGGNSLGQIFSTVSCSSPVFCAAGGSAVGSSGVRTPLLATWNGTTWAVDSSPRGTRGSGYINGVSCSSSRSCMGVGSFGSASLVEHWNGSVWTPQRAPKPTSATKAALTGVSCSTARTCRAVGFRSVGHSSETLAMSWNGVRWSISPTPLSSITTPSALEEVSCSSAFACVSVGFQTVSGTPQPLAERFG